MKKVLALLSFVVLALSMTFAQNRQQLSGVSVVAPVTLKTDGPTKGTTNAGKEYVSTMYKGSLPNGDTYFVYTSSYPFTLAPEDEDRAINGFIGAIPGGEIVKAKQNITVGGRHAVAVAFRATDKDGSKMDFFWVFAYNGNTAYQFMFGTDEAVKDTDTDAVKQFFSSVLYN